MAQEFKPEQDQLIDRILEYKVGAYEKFHDALPGEMDGLRLNIVLFGMTGSGKSALINSIFTSLYQEEPAMIQTAGKEGTRILENCDLPSDVTFYDTAGFFDLGKIEQGILLSVFPKHNFVLVLRLENDLSNDFELSG